MRLPIILHASSRFVYWPSCTTIPEAGPVGTSRVILRRSHIVLSGKRFWVFHASYWLLAGVALFAYGLTYGHWEIALIRNVYNPLVGFAYALLMRAAFIHRMPSDLAYRLLMILAMSLVGALISALLANPVTYALLGYDLRELQWGFLLQDGLYFLLFYVIWCLLYLQLSQPETSKPGCSNPRGASSGRIAKWNFHSPSSER